MKAGMKKVILLSGMVCMLGLLTAGCGLSSENGEAAESGQTDERDNTAEPGQTDERDNTAEPGQADEQDNIAEPGQADEQDSIADSQQAAAQGEEDANEMQGTSTGRWHVLDPETAAAVDADFEGVVWKINADCFYIVESTTELLEGGSISSSPAVGAEVPDSELIRVVFREDTHFYTRTIYDSGARYEDAEAEFKDLEQYCSVALKGEFKNDVFCAGEVRIVKIP